jgi:hypothetical protein
MSPQLFFHPFRPCCSIRHCDSSRLAKRLNRLFEMRKCMNHLNMAEASLDFASQCLCHRSNRETSLNSSCLLEPWRDEPTDDVITRLQVSCPLRRLGEGFGPFHSACSHNRRFGSPWALAGLVEHRISSQLSRRCRPCLLSDPVHLHPHESRNHRSPDSACHAQCPGSRHRHRIV